MHDAGVEYAQCMHELGMEGAGNLGKATMHVTRMVHGTRMVHVTRMVRVTRMVSCMFHACLIPEKRTTLL